MENYDLIYMTERVKFMLNMGDKQLAQTTVEREVPFMVKECNSGRAELTFNFFKLFNKLLTEKSCSRISSAILDCGNKKVIEDYTRIFGNENSLSASV